MNSFGRALLRGTVQSLPEMVVITPFVHSVMQGKKGYVELSRIFRTALEVKSSGSIVVEFWIVNAFLLFLSSLRALRVVHSDSSPLPRNVPV
ncbi:hypothetical protein VNO77_35897 [Canavalia gladiata]|uniref:Uncharacterized protein n=1 Tax=Canavalia gladiata TaxID=3824 RepID=A0AAN9KAG0_CANGL